MSLRPANILLTLLVVGCGSQPAPRAVPKPPDARDASALPVAASPPADTPSWATPIAVPVQAPEPVAPEVEAPPAKSLAKLPRRLASKKLRDCARADKSVLRLELSWNGSVLSVADCEAVDMMIPTGRAAEFGSAIDEYTGSWGELHNAQSEVLFAENTHASLTCPSVESFGAGGHPHTAPSARPSPKAPQTLYFDVPNRKDATTFVWFDRPCRGQGASTPIGALELR